MCEVYLLIMTLPFCPLQEEMKHREYHSGGVVGVRLMSRIALMNFCREALLLAFFDAKGRGLERAR